MIISSLAPKVILVEIFTLGTSDSVSGAKEDSCHKSFVAEEKSLVHANISEYVSTQEV